MNCFANWERIDVSEQPTARWGHSSYIYRDNIYIYGGFSGYIYFFLHSILSILEMLLKHILVMLILLI